MRNPLQLELNLGAAAEDPVLTALEQLRPSLSEEFFGWAITAHHDGVLRLVLNEVMLREGLLEYLAAIYELHDHVAAGLSRRTAVTNADMKGKSPHREMRRMLLKNGGDNGDNDGVDYDWRGPGRVLHSHFAGIFGEPGRKETPVQLDFEEELDAHMEEALVLFAVEEDWNGGKSGGAGEINQLWQELRPLVADHNMWFRNYDRAAIIARKTELLLNDLFRSSTQRLPVATEPVGRYLKTVAVTTWAMTVATPFLSSFHGRLIFPEVAVLDQSFGLGPRRADALEVLFDGEPPSAEDRRICRKLVGDVNLPTAARIIDVIRRAVGDDVNVTGRIFDWKAAVGDNSEAKGSRGGVITAEEIKSGPLQEHQSQIAYYLAACAIESHWLRHGVREITAGFAASPVREGTLFYLLPNGWVEHEVNLAHAEAYFRKDFVPGLRRAMAQSRVRRVAQEVLSYLRGNGGPGNNHQQEEISGRRSPAPNEPHIIVVAELFREFLDVTRIIELGRERRNGNRDLVLHLDALEKGVKGGRVKIGKFEWAKGGMIKCLNPEHNDPNPSFHVWLETGTWKCFGCGIHGRIARESVPTGKRRVQVISREWNSRPPMPKSVQDLVIPHDFEQLMADTQTLLQKEFRGSIAERYLREKRKLDPESAIRHGAGFGTDTLVLGLLKRGHTLETLEKFGLISYVRMSSDDPFLKKLCGFLQLPSVRGLGRESEAGKERVVYPKNTLKGYLTFPLGLWGKNLNFYGRSVVSADKRLAHRKLKTGYPQGGFNVSCFESNCGEIIVSEAVIDALTVMQALPGSNVVAFIGTDNELIRAALASSKKRIALALDFDEAGRSAVAKIMEQLGKIGCEARDLTPEFFERFPAAARYDDYNSWWVAEGCK